MNKTTEANAVDMNADSDVPVPGEDGSVQAKSQVKTKNVILTWARLSLVMLMGASGTGMFLWTGYQENLFMQTAIHAQGRIENRLGRGEFVVFNAPQGIIEIPIGQIVERRDQIDSNGQIDILFPPDNPVAARRLSYEQTVLRIWPIGALVGASLMFLSAIGMRQVRRKVAEAAAN